MIQGAKADPGGPAIREAAPLPTKAGKRNDQIIPAGAGQRNYLILPAKGGDRNDQILYASSLKSTPAPL